MPLVTNLNMYGRSIFPSIITWHRCYFSLCYASSNLTGSLQCLQPRLNFFLFVRISLGSMSCQSTVCMFLWSLSGFFHTSFNHLDLSDQRISDLTQKLRTQDGRTETQTFWYSVKYGIFEAYFSATNGVTLIVGAPYVPPPASSAAAPSVPLMPAYQQESAEPGWNDPPPISNKKKVKNAS